MARHSVVSPLVIDRREARSCEEILARLLEIGFLEKGDDYRRWAERSLNLSLFGLFGPPNVQKLAFNNDIPGLIRALTYRKDASVRRSAAGALGWPGDERAIGPLVAALADSAVDVRTAAAGALESMDLRWSESDAARAAVPELIAVMESRGPSTHLRTVEDHERGSAIRVRRAAATVLGRIGGARAIDALIQAVQRHRDSNVRLVAAEMLGNSKDPRAIAPLLGALIDIDYLVCKEAARALPKIDVNWTKSDAARAAVPMFKAALEESQRTLQALADAPEEPETDFIPDLAAPAARFRNELRVESEEQGHTVSWAAKEALKLVGADEPGPTARQ